MSQVSTSPALGIAASPERRDIGLRRRYAAERRFRVDAGSVTLDQRQ